MFIKLVFCVKNPTILDCDCKYNDKTALKKRVNLNLMYQRFGNIEPTKT